MKRRPVLERARLTRAYLWLLAALVPVWLVLQAGPLAQLLEGGALAAALGIIALYGASHLFRMLRLALLTLDQRNQVLPLIGAHALTAFPSSFLPFKIGEILRLAAFFHVFGYRRKALAVWLAERFGDVVVLAALILGLYLFQVSLPAAMRTVFFFFVLASLFGLLALLAVAKTFVYLSRHLVLVSQSAHGLLLLRASHALRQLELDLHKSVEGRVSGLLLLSLMIWGLEVSALSLFLHLAAASGAGFTALFASGLLSSVSGNAPGAGFGLYQSLALVILTLFALAAAARSRIKRPE